jgi:IS30 family transposase
MHFRRQRDILLTLQERRSRLTLARRLLGKDAELAAEAIAAELGGLASCRMRRAVMLPLSYCSPSASSRRSVSGFKAP